MRVAGVVIDRVPRSHILGVVLHLHLELPAQDKVELLPVVLGEVDGLLLLLLRKGRGDEEGLGNLAGKAVGQVVVGEAGAAVDAQPLPLADDRVEGEVRGLAGEQLDDVDAERLRAVIKEGKGEVALSVLGGEVFLGGKGRSAAPSPRPESP